MNHIFGETIRVQDIVNFHSQIVSLTAGHINSNL